MPLELYKNVQLLGGPLLLRKHVLQRKWSIIMFTLIWLILSGNFSIANIIAGIVVSIASLYSAHRLLFLPKISKVSFTKFIVYPFYLIGQIYISSISVIKVIIKGGRAEIVKVNTDINTGFLLTILCNSITLTPGTIVLDQRNDELTILWLREKDAISVTSDCGDAVKGKLESKLLKMQKRK